MTDIKPSPGAYAELVRPLTGSELETLRESMGQHGWWPGSPGTMDEDGVIITGHHRFAVATDLGIEPNFVVVTGLTDDEKKLRAITDNVSRRQLIKADRAGLLKQMRDLGLSIRSIAEQTGLGFGTVHRDLEAAEDQLIQSGSPDADADDQVSHTGTPEGRPAGQPTKRVRGRDGKSHPARKTAGKPNTPKVTEWAPEPGTPHAGKLRAVWNRNRWDIEGLQPGEWSGGGVEPSLKKAQARIGNLIEMRAKAAAGEVDLRGIGSILHLLGQAVGDAGGHRWSDVDVPPEKFVAFVTDDGWAAAPTFVSAAAQWCSEVDRLLQARNGTGRRVRA